MKKKLLYISILLYVLTLGSKVLGFIKEAALAYQYGAGTITDAYLFSQNIMTTIFSVFTGALNMGYISVMASKKDHNGTLSSLLKLLSIILIGISTILFVFAPIIVRTCASGFDIESVNLSTSMLRIMIPFGIFQIILYLLSADLESKEVFWQIGVYGIIGNVVLILSIVLSNGSYRILALGYGLSLLIQAIFVYILSKKKGFKYVFNVRIKDEDLKKIIIVSMPLLFIEFFTNAITLVDKFFASSFSTGIITDINYASRIVTMVLTFFVSVISRIIMPILVKRVDSKRMKDFTNISRQSMIYVLIISIPLFLMIFFEADKMINILLLRGNFSREHAAITSKLLCLYSINIIPLSLLGVIKSELYALKKNTKTMWLNLISFLCNIVLDYVLIKYMGYLGIALASVISSIILLILMYLFLRKNFEKVSIKDFVNSLIKLTVSFVIMGLSLFILNKYLTIRNEFVDIVVKCGLSTIIYIFILIILKIKELSEMIQLVKRKKV